MKTGTIFNIQRFCLHDGPGIRSVVFFKGCPLYCRWCSNPESQSSKPQIMYNSLRCLKCGECGVACKIGAISVSDRNVTIDRRTCTVCGDCAKICPKGAMSVTGNTVSVESVFSTLIRDRDYYATSGGGVTFSGGEATLQSEFLLNLADLLKKERISLALETCGVCDKTLFRKIAATMDYILFDVKLLDAEKFLQYTGGKLEAVLQNLKTASELSQLVIRVPLIPSVNMDEQFYGALGNLCMEINPKAIQLLPYHRLGAGKYGSLGSHYWDVAPASIDENQAAKERLTMLCKCNVELLV